MNTPQNAKRPTLESIQRMTDKLIERIKQGDPRRTIEFGLTYNPYLGLLSLGIDDIATRHVSVSKWIKNYRENELQQHEDEGNQPYATIDDVMHDYENAVYSTTDTSDTKNTMHAKIAKGIKYVADDYDETTSEHATTYEAKQQLQTIIYCAKDVLERISYDVSGETNNIDLDEIIHMAKSIKKDLE